MQRAIESEKHLAHIYANKWRLGVMKSGKKNWIMTMWHQMNTTQLNHGTQIASSHLHLMYWNVIEIQWNRNWFASVTRIGVWKIGQSVHRPTAIRKNVHKTDSICFFFLLFVSFKATATEYRKMHVFVFGSWIWHTISLHSTAQRKKRTFGILHH